MSVAWIIINLANFRGGGVFGGDVFEEGGVFGGGSFRRWKFSEGKFSEGKFSEVRCNYEGPGEYSEGAGDSDRIYLCTGYSEEIGRTYL